MKPFTIVLLLLVLISCKSNTKIKTKENTYDDSLNKPEEVIQSFDYNGVFSKKDTNLYGYHFVFGYHQYDEEKFGFSNPGYLNIYKNEELIFTDNFEAYEELSIKTYGFHNFEKQILIFSLNWGLEACDYINPSLFYGIGNLKVYKIEEFYRQSTDYASKFYEIIYPEDPNGIKNILTVIDKINYPSGEEPNKRDTLYFEMTKSGFVKKL
jgi:hypothetical protein